MLRQRQQESERNVLEALEHEFYKGLNPPAEQQHARHKHAQENKLSQKQP
jgi:hypothetical protein